MMTTVDFPATVSSPGLSGGGWPSGGKPPAEKGWTPPSCGATACVAWDSLPDCGQGDDLSEKAGPAMYEDENDDRFEAALRLAEDDPARGAVALGGIVADDGFDPDIRSEAAARLAEVGG